MGVICTVSELQHLYLTYPDFSYDRLQNITTRMCSPNIYIHSHEEYEVFINIGDPVYYVTGNHMTELPCGGAILVPPGIEHYAFNEYNDLYHRVRLHISPYMIECLYHFQPTLKNYFTFPCCFTVLRNAFMGNIYAVEKAAEQIVNESILSVAIPVFSLLLQIDQSMAENGKQTKDSIKIPPLLCDILKYMNVEENFLSINSNREIAQKFFITESYLSRLFQKYMPMTAHQYLLTLKMNYAKRRLQEGFSVTEVCFAVGFSDCSHFIKTYRQFIGETPGKTTVNLP